MLDLGKRAIRAVRVRLTHSTHPTWPYPLSPSSACKGKSHLSVVAVERSTTLEGGALHTPGSLSFRDDKIELPDECSQARRQGRTRERPKRAALSADSMAPASGWHKATICGRTRGAVGVVHGCPLNRSVPLRWHEGRPRCRIYNRPRCRIFARPGCRL